MTMTAGLNFKEYLRFMVRGRIEDTDSTHCLITYIAKES